MSGTSYKAQDQLDVDKSSTMRVLFQESFGWNQCRIGEETLYYRGADALRAAMDILEISSSDENKIYAGSVERTLKKYEGFSSGILVSGTKVVAWSDHIRSYPVFYSTRNDGCVVSNDARTLLESMPDHAVPDEVSALEFAMAGYVTGSQTLYQNIFCLQAGEYFIWDTKESSLYKGRFFQYAPSPQIDLGIDVYLYDLGAVIDSIINRIATAASGRPIWIPLSGGLDSRIILCKLHELGYKNIHTFTYGPHLNFEALRARKVAKALDVPWHYVPIGSGEARAEYNSDVRKSYSRFADGLKSAPSMREYTAFKKLIDKKIIDADAIIINGQSGDYITGGHVSDMWFSDKDCHDEDLHQILLGKHYDLWRSLNTEENFAIIRKKIKSVLGSVPARAAPLDYAVLEEMWEYDSRQIDLVVNGQRAYDFFGYDWELPLWEKTLVLFYETIPYQYKRQQALYKEYLRRYNYKGLFPQTEPYIWRWPLYMMWVVPAARVVGLFSKQAKKDIYGLLRYWGHYSNQYSFFPFGLYKKLYKKCRNIFSLYVRHWFIENGYPLKDDLKKGMAIDES